MSEGAVPERIPTSEIPALVRDVGIEPGAAFERDGTRVWDLELDGDRRRGLKVSLIDEGRDDGAVVVWAHLAPPLGDGLRKAYRRLLEWNDRYVYAKFGVAADGRPVLSVEIPSQRADARTLLEALARVVFIADELLDETAAWIWIGGRQPADSDAPRRNRALLERHRSLVGRLEG